MSTRVLLDANVFLELELAEQHADACKRFLGKVRDGLIESAITEFHVDSIVIVMENYGKNWNDLTLFLASLLRYKGLRIHRMSLSSRIKATYFMKEYGLDFDDALAIQALKELSMDTIVSYDDDFDSVNWVKRITPEDVL
ncbi:MAG: type II toxin-antitoxin system VapC family toxin [Thermoproteota archaeon]|nr:type II toxin-antitoxin system VapC family toxin [Candidatus Brockarchaeota archaeon]MBO3840690.1 type II toxin-antitoxin system VapC family toxin [Candidatus Brockarchaeota archaeon]